MIDEVLSILTDKLNTHLLFEFGLPSDVIFLGPITTTTRQARDKLILSLAHVSQDVSARSALPVRPPGADGVTTPTPLNLNLHILVAANFDDRYTDGLAQLSAAITYFQERPVFTRKTTPNLPAKIERISVDWQDMDMTAQTALWSNLGRSYLPSALFRVRVVTVRDVAMFGEAARAQTTGYDSE